MPKGIPGPNIKAAPRTGAERSVAPKPSRNGVTHRSYSIVQNGQVRPQPHTNCGRCWAIFDTLFARDSHPPFRADALNACVKAGFNRVLAQGQFTHWKRFNGIKHRLQAPKLIKKIAA